MKETWGLFAYQIGFGGKVGLKRKLPGALFICGMLLLATTLLTACAESDDVTLIRQVISDAAEKAEAHDVSGVMDLTANGFYADPGMHDQRSVRGILWWAFKRYGEFRVLFPLPRVEVSDSGNTAEAVVFFVITQKDGIVPDLDGLYEDPEGWLEELGSGTDLFQLALSFAKINGEWRVTDAELSQYG